MITLVEILVSAIIGLFTSITEVPPTEQAIYFMKDAEPNFECKIQCPSKELLNCYQLYRTV